MSSSVYEGSKVHRGRGRKRFKGFIRRRKPCADADVIFVAIPDTKQPSAYEKDIKPNLTKGPTLLFSHGFAIHFKTVVPPSKNVNA